MWVEAKGVVDIELEVRTQNAFVRTNFNLYTQAVSDKGPGVEGVVYVEPGVRTQKCIYQHRLQRVHAGCV